MNLRICMVALLIGGCKDGATPKEEPIVYAPDRPPEDSGEAVLPTSFEVTGTVVDSTGTPVQEAMVLVGGQSDTMVLSDENGEFSLWFEDNGLGVPAIVAAKSDHRAAGMEYFKPETPITLVLLEVNPPDNTEYTYEDPGDGINTMAENCTHCHTTFVRDFLDSKHAEATRNPLLQDLYAGVTQAYTDAESCEDAGGLWRSGHDPGTENGTIEKCYLGGGVLPDLNPTCGGPDQPACDSPSISDSESPDSFGACADCHAPGINGVAGGRNLHEAHGLAYELGVHCDTCHKVRDIDMSLPPGVGNRLVMGRPGEPGAFPWPWEPVFYGPLVDVPNVAMGGSHQPKFNEAVFCAGCHEQNQEALVPGTNLDPTVWPEGLPIHSTYTEWADGPYNQEATACQFCHMPANVELNNSVDISRPEDQSIAFGFPRPPEDNRNHTFRGPLDGSPRLIDEALYVSVMVEPVAGSIEATVSVANIGCGHAVPTGEPMRSLFLLVEAEADCGILAPTGGLTISDRGGAWAIGRIGENMTVSGSTLQWPKALDVLEVGQTVRAVRPSGVFYDYAGPGVFDEEGFDAEDKGMEIESPVGTATIIEILGEQILLDQELDLLLGDKVYLGDPWPEEPTDGQDAVHIAGQAGTSFAKVLVDASGNRHVPHYRAIDIASDNRIPPGSNALTSHAFELPAGCNTGEVRATVLYRPVPLSMAKVRGWASQDYIVSSSVTSWGVD